MAQLPQNYESWQNRNEPQKNDYPNWENMNDDEILDLVEDRKYFNMLSICDQRIVTRLADEITALKLAEA